jgi:hypothetical protein
MGGVWPPVSEAPAEDLISDDTLRGRSRYKFRFEENRHDKFVLEF